jgi:hypothetical protein
MISYNASVFPPKILELSINLDIVYPINDHFAQGTWVSDNLKPSIKNPLITIISKYERIK